MRERPRGIGWKIKDETNEKVVEHDARQAAASDARNRTPQDGAGGHAHIQRPEHHEPDDENGGGTVQRARERITGPALRRHPVGKSHRHGKDQGAGEPSRGCAQQASFHGLSVAVHNRNYSFFILFYASSGMLINEKASLHVGPRMTLLQQAFSDVVVWFYIGT